MAKEKEGFLRLDGEKFAYKIQMTSDLMAELNDKKMEFVYVNRIRKGGEIEEMIVAKSRIAYVQSAPAGKSEVETGKPDSGEIY